ncbi:MAG: cysteine synthase family protein [Oscillospiraceae bacterium]|nr:cysteine synthase family protein [Oscillospiraceae bacterium]
MFEIGHTIGNTPMVKIKYNYNGKVKNIYTKLESYNLTGSIKDRVAYYIINNAIKRGELKKEMPIVEATSGNTGISLAAIGAYYKNPVYIFMPSWVSIERLDLMNLYNANVTLISKEDGGFIKCVSESKKLAKELNGFLSNQFANNDNFLAHYETTGAEIIQQLPEEISGFVSGIGTGGTLMGVGKRLKEKTSDILVVAIEPDKMPIISKGEIIEQHKIEGIGDDFIPDLIDKSMIDKIILVNDDDSINMARKLSKELGLGVGISSGANFIGSVLLSEMLNEPVVTVFPDDNKKYLSTDLSQSIDRNKNFISNNIELLDYEIII